ncbi:LPXTG cell wall anchor domain-containing protein [Actinoplanes sp. NPDC026670]|uniref:LPXTG cell wall anchor domain-containing protein n=1 Tax=Actinoplanes sp. NPDC026670 TaxID=3154700 RepID=UPI0033E5AB40
MRRKITAGAVLTLALLIPAAPAVAQAAAPGLDASCQTVERKVFTDIRTLITIDLDTADAGQVRVLAYRILDAVKADSLAFLPGLIEEKLGAPEADLRAFLKKDVVTTWMHSLRVAVGNTMQNAGTNVRAAANKTLDDGGYDALLAYLNEGLYAARELDCKATSPSPSPSVTPSATPTATASATPGTTPDGEDEGDGEGGGLPVTGSNTGIVVGVGGALLVLGAGGYLVGRRRRARFEA